MPKRYQTRGHVGHLERIAFLQSLARAQSVRPGLGRLAAQSLPGYAKIKAGHYLQMPYRCPGFDAQAPTCHAVKLTV